MPLLLIPLRFTHTHEQLLNEIKLERLRGKLADAEQDILEQRYITLDKVGVSRLFSGLKNRQS
jgi:hypothetical protein